MSSYPTSYGRISLFNFASETIPEGGFLTSGCQTQEESLARSSTLYPSLMTDTTPKFYRHRKDLQGGFYYHAMIYSRGIVILKDDKGDWVSPFEVNILMLP